MKKLTEVIIRHEKARSVVSELSEKRRSLVSGCEGLDTIDDNHNQTVSVGVPCGVTAWGEMVKENIRLEYDEQLQFEDVFYHEMNDGDGACENCKAAFDIKRGVLADARKEFGNAKRAMARLGKRLILESTK